MKKALSIILLVALAGCTSNNYKECPSSPYKAHSFSPTILHETYQWAKCDNCGLEIRDVYDSDYIQIKNPTTEELVKYPKKFLYPKYEYSNELAGQ